MGPHSIFMRDTSRDEAHAAAIKIREDSKADPDGPSYNFFKRWRARTAPDTGRIEADCVSSRNENRGFYLLTALGPSPVARAIGPLSETLAQTTSGRYCRDLSGGLADALGALGVGPVSRIFLAGMMNPGRFVRRRLKTYAI